jgi:hypothetical protein
MYANGRGDHRIAAPVQRVHLLQAARRELAAGTWTALLGGLSGPVSVSPARGQTAALPRADAVPPAIMDAKDC